MAAKKGSTGRSARSGTATGRDRTTTKNLKSTKTSKTSKSGKLSGGTVPRPKVTGGKVPKTKVTGGKVATGGGKRLTSGAGTVTTGLVPAEAVPVERLYVEQLLVEKVPVTGRLIKLGTVDRDRARVLEEVITGATEVTLTTGTGKTATLNGALLGMLRTVAGAIEHGEAVTVLSEDTETDLAGAVISSQEAADLLNVSRPHVVKLAKTGQLAHHMVGNRHRFALADVLAYAEQMHGVRSEALAAIAPAGGYSAEDF
jgi:excisionase family DNA binding protein